MYGRHAGTGQISSNKDSKTAAGYTYPDESSTNRSEYGLYHHMFQSLRPALPIII